MEGRRKGGREMGGWVDWGWYDLNKIESIFN